MSRHTYRGARPIHSGWTAPTESPGVTAPVGAFFYRLPELAGRHQPSRYGLGPGMRSVGPDNAGEWWQKTGDAPTAWTQKVGGAAPTWDELG